jgi:hypothetical protein
VRTSLVAGEAGEAYARCCQDDLAMIPAQDRRAIARHEWWGRFGHACGAAADMDSSLAARPGKVKHLVAVLQIRVPDARTAGVASREANA